MTDPTRYLSDAAGCGPHTVEPVDGKCPACGGLGLVNVTGRNVPLIDMLCPACAPKPGENLGVTL